MKFLIAGLVCIMAASAHAKGQFEFAFGKDVPADLRRFIEDTSAKTAEFFREEVGAELPMGTLVVASGDAKFVARQYMRNRGIGSGLSRWTRTWSKEREAEGAYGAIFIRTSSASFNTDFGGGIERQRMRMIAHELFHVLQYELVGPRARNCCEPNNRIPVVGPIWLMEGSAQYVMFRFEHYATGASVTGAINWASTERWNLKGTLADLETRDQMNQHSQGYGAGMSAVYRLTQKGGLSSLADYWRAIGKGESWEKALESAFGWTKEVVYRRL